MNRKTLYFSYILALFSSELVRCSLTIFSGIDPEVYMNAVSCSLFFYRVAVVVTQRYCTVQYCNHVQHLGICCFHILLAILFIYL